MLVAQILEHREDLFLNKRFNMKQTANTQAVHVNSLTVKEPNKHKIFRIQKADFFLDISLLVAKYDLLQRGDFWPSSCGPGDRNIG